VHTLLLYFERRRTTETSPSPVDKSRLCMIASQSYDGVHFELEYTELKKHTVLKFHFLMMNIRENSRSEPMTRTSNVHIVTTMTPMTFCVGGLMKSASIPFGGGLPGKVRRTCSCCSGDSVLKTTMKASIAGRVSLL
jgi:hypothetical protein